MATGIRKRHGRTCRSHEGGRCNCNEGYEAWVWSRREGKKVRRVFQREAEAKSWRADALRAANRGTLQTERRDTRRLDDALEDFVEGMRAGTVRPKGRSAYKPNTIRAYERAVRIHVAPFLGSLKVTDVRRTDVQALADELVAAGLAPGSVANALNPIQAFYRRAIDRDELAYNPAERIDVPVAGNGRPKRIASPREAAALIEALPADDRALWATAFYAGLRRGELQALRCCDVELGASRIHVEFGWDQEEGTIDPKSESSRRTVPLSVVLRDHLDQHVVRCGRSGEELIFGRSSSQPFAPMTIGKRATKAWEAAGLDPITLHEGRHTYASLLIDAGANPKAIQVYMGHSKIQTTFDTYGHLMPGSHDEIRLRMDEYLARGAGETGAQTGAQPLEDAEAESVG